MYYNIIRYLTDREVELKISELVPLIVREKIDPSDIGSIAASAERSERITESFGGNYAVPIASIHRNCLYAIVTALHERGVLSDTNLTAR